MTCRALKSVNFNGFTKPADILKSLEAELLDLSDICRDVDFSNPSDVAQFERNVLFIKGYYERFERLIRDGQTDK